MENKRIKRNMLVVWLSNQKKVCIMILLSYLILIHYIQVLSDNTMYVLVNLIDQDCHYLNFIKQKDKKNKIIKDKK